MAKCQTETRKRERETVAGKIRSWPRVSIFCTHEAPGGLGLAKPHPSFHTRTGERERMREREREREREKRW